MTIQSSDGDLEEAVNQHVGLGFFDVHPDAAPEFLPGFGLALEHGFHNFVRAYHDCAVACLCTRVDDGLLVCFKTLPLAGLTESLRTVVDALSAPEPGL